MDDELLDIFGDHTKQIIQNLKENYIENQSTNECLHGDTFIDNNMIYCNNCGCEVKRIDYEIDGGIFGAEGDVDYVNIPKEKEKNNVKKVFDECNILNVDMKVRHITENKYKEIIGTTLLRGKTNKSIIATCLYYAYEEVGQSRTMDEIRNMFDLTKREMSKGMTMYQEKIPESRIATVTPIHLIRRILEQTGIDICHLPNILKIAKSINNTDEILNSSTPQSVAPAIVYLYLFLIPDYKEEKGLTKTKFSNLTNTTDITLTKLLKRIGLLIGKITFDDKVIKFADNTVTSIH